jgi:hypothetical protein
MSNLTRSRSKPRDTFGIRSLCDYGFDLEAMSESEFEEAGKLTGTFKVDFSKVSPFLKGTDGYSELEEYGRFFADLRGFLSKEKGNDRSFGIDTGVELENILKDYGFKGTLADMLTLAYDNEMISEDDYKLLNSFRDFRNDCAHSLTIPKISKKERTRWSNAVKRLKPTEESQ